MDKIKKKKTQQCNATNKEPDRSEEVEIEIRHQVFLFSAAAVS